MARLGELKGLLEAIPEFAGLDIVSIGLRVSYAGDARSIEDVLAMNCPDNLTAPLTLRQVQFTIKQLQETLNEVRARRAELRSTGVHMPLIQLDIPRNRLVARLSSGYIEGRKRLSDLESKGLYISDVLMKPIPRLSSTDRALRGDQDVSE